MIPIYGQDECRAGGEYLRSDGGFDAIKVVVDAIGVDGLEAIAKVFRALRPSGTRAEFTRFVITWVNRPRLSDAPMMRYRHLRRAA